MSPPRSHDSRPIALGGSGGSPDGFALLLDRLDRIDDTLNGLDARMRAVENTCERIETMQEAARSRISRETKAASDADKSLEERVRELENDAAESKGEARAGKRFAAIVALAASGGTFGLGKLAELLGAS